MTEHESGDARTPELFELLVEEFCSGGLATVLVPATGEFPAQLVVSIDDNAAEQLRISTYFVPGVVNPPALQYFTTLPYPVDADSAASIARFLAALNAELPITGFEFGERGGVVAFRHTHAVSVSPLDPGVIAWTWSMIRSTITEFGPTVSDVCAGADLEAAFTAMHARFAGFSDA